MNLGNQDFPFFINFNDFFFLMQTLISYHRLYVFHLKQGIIFADRMLEVNSHGIIGIYKFNISTKIWFFVDIINF